MGMWCQNDKRTTKTESGKNIVGPEVIRLQTAHFIICEMKKKNHFKSQGVQNHQSVPTRVLCSDWLRYFLFVTWGTK